MTYAGSGNTVLLSDFAEADLVATAFDAISDHVRTGQTDVTFTVANVGLFDATAFATHVVWSANDVIGDGDDFVVAGSATTFTGLAAGTNETKTISLQLNRATLYANASTADLAGQQVGTTSLDTSRLLLVIDVNLDITESNEFNNSGQGHLLDSDDITYFPWDIDGNGVVTPVETLQAIRAIDTSEAVHDFDGNAVVTPLEALAVLQRIGYVRNSDVVDDAELLQADGVTADIGQGPTNQLGLLNPPVVGELSAVVTAFAPPELDEDDGLSFPRNSTDFAPALTQPTAEFVLSDGVFATSVDWLISLQIETSES